MEVRNCKDCGKLFNYDSGVRLCPACKQKLEDKFQQVRDYIWDNPHESLTVISEVNDVSVAQIKQWIREERLVFEDSSIAGLECENCGALINTGRFCPECKTKMKHSLNNALDKPKVIKANKSSRDKERMRFLDK